MITIRRAIAGFLAAVKRAFAPAASAAQEKQSPNQDHARYLASCLQLTEMQSFKRPAAKGGEWRDKRKGL